MSADGRFVAFVSGSPDLVPGDTNGTWEIFVRDRKIGTTTRVSVSSTGEQANGQSNDPTISADGRHVAFWSIASNLVAGDTNGREDVFVHDQLTGTTVRVSVTSNGVQLAGSSRWPTISSTGRYVAFPSTSFSTASLMIHDRDADEDGAFDEPGAIATVTVRPASGFATSLSSVGSPALSADARFVAFQAHGIFADGRWTRVLLHDRDADADGIFDEADGTTTINVSGGYADTPRLTPDGRYLSFSGHSALVPDDTNGIADVFVYDVVAAATRRVSVDSSGAEAFDSQQRGSLHPAISASGRFVTFVSYALHAPGDVTDTGDLFVHDRDVDADGVFDEPGAVETRRVSEGVGGEKMNDGCEFPDISADGSHVAFGSPSSNLVADDTNGQFDVFIQDLNRAPVAGPILPSPSLVAVRTPLDARATFADADRGDIHTAVWSWGDGTTEGAAITGTGGAGTISGSHSYATAGIFVVTLTVADQRGASSTSRYEYVVAYDPTGGFVTGNGTITSPAGAYQPDPTLTGPARVSFVSKYHKGASEPTGSAVFDFRLGDLSFQSESYAWLVVAGSRAQLKGTGRINGAGSFGFMLTAIDGDLAGGGAADAVRVKIWDLFGGAVVYDSQSGAADDAAAATEIKGGSIVIHK